MDSKKGLSRIISALLAATSVIGGASAGKKEVGKRPNSAGVVVNKGGNNHKERSLRRRAKSAPPLLKNPKTCYLGVPTAIGVAGAGYGLYRLFSKGEKKEEEKKEEKDKIEDKAGEKGELNFAEEDIKKLSECGLSDYLNNFQFRGLSNWDGEGVEWSSFSDGDDASRKFDIIDFSVEVDGERRGNAYVSRAFYDGKNVKTLSLRQDNGRTKSNLLQVDFRLNGMGVLYFPCDSKKGPIENYAHAIAEAAFFCNLCFTYGERWPGSEYYLRRYKDCLNFVKNKREKCYNDNKDKIDGLFEGFKILEKCLCEVLRNEEKKMQNAKK